MSKKKISISVNIIAVAIAISILGIVLLIITSIEGISGKVWDSWLKMFLQALGTTLASAGLVSLLIECSTIKRMTEGAIKSILEGDIDFSGYSTNTLDKMTYKIAAQRCNPTQNVETLKNSIYKYEDEMINSVCGLYYDHHNADFIINKKGDHFIKTAKLDYEIINKNSFNNRIEKTIYLFSNDKEMDATESQKYLNIKKLSINGKDYTEEANENVAIKKVDRPDDSVYKYEISFKKEIDPNIKKTKVKMEMEYELPNTDLIHIYKIPYPCKRLDHNIYIQIDGWELDGTSFAEFDCGFNNETNKCAVKQTVKNTINVEFKDWCMPGAGYVASYKRII